VMIPVRMDFDSEFGTFTAELAELRGRGVYLRLPEWSRAAAPQPFSRQRL